MTIEERRAWLQNEFRSALAALDASTNPHAFVLGWLMGAARFTAEEDAAIHKALADRSAAYRSFK
jgi:hypothetical protein